MTNGKRRAVVGVGITGRRLTLFVLSVALRSHHTLAKLLLPRIENARLLRLDVAESGRLVRCGGAGEGAYGGGEGSDAGYEAAGEHGGAGQASLQGEVR